MAVDAIASSRSGDKTKAGLPSALSTILFETDDFAHASLCSGRKKSFVSLDVIFT
eukprot:COSAG02_NODE_718_length_18064_cov_5.507932_15_plen_55_part_00